MTAGDGPGGPAPGLPIISLLVLRQEWREACQHEAGPLIGIAVECAAKPLAPKAKHADLRQVRVWLSLFQSLSSLSPWAHHLSLKGICFHRYGPTGLNSGRGSLLPLRQVPARHYNQYEHYLFYSIIGNFVNLIYQDWAMFPEAVFSAFYLIPWRRYQG